MNELKILLRIDCDVKGKKVLYLIIIWNKRKNVFIDKCWKIEDEGLCVLLSFMILFYLFLFKNDFDYGICICI